MKLSIKDISQISTKINTVANCQVYNDFQITNQTHYNVYSLGAYILNPTSESVWNVFDEVYNHVDIFLDQIIYETIN